MCSVVLHGPLGRGRRRRRRREVRRGGRRPGTGTAREARYPRRARDAGEARSTRLAATAGPVVATAVGIALAAPTIRAAAHLSTHLLDQATQLVDLLLHLT